MYGNQVANFLASIVLARLLLPEEYGYVALIAVFTGFVTLFSDAGLSFSVIRSEYGSTFHRATSNLAFYIGLLLFLIMLLLAWPIAYFYEDYSLIWPTIILSLSYIFGALQIVPMAIVSKKMDFNYVGKVRFIANCVSIFLMILMALLGFSYWSLIFPSLILQIVQFILFEKKVKLGFKLYNFSYTIAAFKIAKSLLFNLSSFNLMNYWAANADGLIIGKYYGKYDLGIYQRAFKLLQLPYSFVSGLFGTVLYPSLKKFAATGGDFKKEYSSILGVISLLTFPMSAIMILIPNKMVTVLWGNDWMLVADYLPFFGLLIMIQTLLISNGQIFLLLEKEKTFMYLGLIDSVVRILAMVIGAFFSVKGIVIGRLISFLFILVPMSVYFAFVKSFGYSWSFILKFWMPKIILSLFIFFFILLNYQILLYISTGLYLTHIILYQKNELGKIKSIIINRIK